MGTVSKAMMANAVRALAMDAVQKAKSGHPGMPMGMADIAVALFSRHLRANPVNPAWAGRDRFILSNGHGSMLQYAMLHLTGYDLTIEDIKAFRQLGSKTPGHPEVGVTPGVETSTGPLGQGFANAVGMALAEKMLAAEFNRPGFPVIDNRTWCFAGDGCLMEGVSHEAASLAGCWKLDKLVVFYDNNGISIDGNVKDWFADDTAMRFRAYGWNVIEHVDGHDFEALDAAIEKAKANVGGPTLIVCDTVIGKGSPNRQGTSKSHGEALGEEEIALTRENLGWNHPPFEIPEAIYEAMDLRKKGVELEQAYNAMFVDYTIRYPELSAELMRRLAGSLPTDFDQVALKALKDAARAKESVATRKASQKALNELAPALPELLGGSADLTGSNLTNWTGVEPMRPDTYLGRHVNYGVREFAMAAIDNGVALYGGFIPFGGTFLVFSDYSRNALRMAALMGLRMISVFTHDSIGLGEDGPTHQPVEHLNALRLIPNLYVWRPADTVEATAAWISAVQSKTHPTVIVGSRQTIAYTDRDPEVALDQAIDMLNRGAYVLKDAEGGKPDLVILATGSEVPVALKARETLQAEGHGVRVVSVPCLDLLARAPEHERKALLTEAPKIAIEAGTPDLWYRWTAGGPVLGIETFGTSAPAGALWEKYGITAEALCAKARSVLKSA